MDDIVSATEYIAQTRDLLNKLIVNLDQAELRAKPEKCRSLVIFKGKVKNWKVFIKGIAITPIQDQAIKYLGKTYNAQLKEKEQIKGRCGSSPRHLAGRRIFARP